MDIRWLGKGRLEEDGSINDVVSFSDYIVTDTMIMDFLGGTKDPNTNLHKGIAPGYHTDVFLQYLINSLLKNLGMADYFPESYSVKSRGFVPAGATLEGKIYAIIEPLIVKFVPEVKIKGDEASILGDPKDEKKRSVFAYEKHFDNSLRSRILGSGVDGLPDFINNKRAMTKFDFDFTLSGFLRILDSLDEMGLTGGHLKRSYINHGIFYKIMNKFGGSESLELNTSHLIQAVLPTLSSSAIGDYILNEKENGNDILKGRVPMYLSREIRYFERSKMLDWPESITMLTNVSLTGSSGMAAKVKGYLLEGRAKLFEAETKMKLIPESRIPK